MKASGKNLPQILLALLLAAALLLFLGQQLAKQERVAATAVVSVDGNEVLRLPLSPTEERTQAISLEKYGRAITLEMRAGKIHVAASDCPDHRCVQAGWLQQPGEIAVCMPNRTAITIVEEK